MEGRRTTHVAQALWAGVELDGAVAVDATVGNGHDTLAMARMCGPRGRVVGFDVQAAALEVAQARLDAARASGEDLAETELVLGCHSGMAELVHGDSRDVRLVVFNLGYLPGGGNKELVTLPETTLQALKSAVAVISPGGLVSVGLYEGHEGGPQEADAVRRFAETLSHQEWTVTWIAVQNRLTSCPSLLLIHRKEVPTG